MPDIDVLDNRPGSLVVEAERPGLAGAPDQKQRHERDRERDLPDAHRGAEVGGAGQARRSA